MAVADYSIEAERVRANRRRRVARYAAAALLPWSWFVVQRLGGLVDFLAIGLPLFTFCGAMLALAVGAARRRRAPLVLAVSLGLVGVTDTFLPWVPAGGPAPLAELRLRVLAANVAAQRSDGLIESMLSHTADVLVLSELPESLHDKLHDTFPYELVTDQVYEGTVSAKYTGTPNNRAGVGVYSRYPLRLLPDTSGLPEGLPGLRVEVDAPAGRIVVYALHLPKPSPISDGFSTTFGGQSSVAAGVVRSAAAESLPVIIAGDLNISDRQVLYDRFADRFDDAMRDTWGGPTSVKSKVLWRMLLLRIDHIFVSPSLCSDNAARHFLPLSDHRALTVDIGPCPQSR